MRKIYLVEDDDNIRDMVVYALNSAGFAAIGVANGGAFWALAQKELPSLALLDIMLPGDDGLAILKALKQSEKYRQVPVIMLTAKGTEFDRVVGLDLGADDYLTKPFSVMELIARIRAVLRRCEEPGGAKAILTFGEITLDRDRRSVSADGVGVSLTFKEFELLCCLMRNEGIVMSRDKLLEQVWGDDYVGESRTIDMHIKALRQKLGAAGEAIATVRNVGYKIGGSR